MTSTTIKVSTQTRDRLKRQAAASGRSLGEHLTQLADLADRSARMDSLRTAIARTPPSELHSHRSESEEWERAELTDSRRDQ